MTTETATALAIDPALSEILAGACRALVEEADDLLERSSMGMVIRESRDYCSVVCDPAGHVLATGSKDLPGFAGTLEFTLQAVLAEFPVEMMQPGDVYLMNDPFTGGTHNNDVRLIAPVHDAAEVIGFVGSCGHLTDVGGMNPGSFAVRATSTYAEGLRIPPLLFARDGEINGALLALILANIRSPDLTDGDLRAMLAAVGRASDRLIELAQKHGHEVLSAWMTHYLGFGEASLREQIKMLPDGRYTWTDWIDQDPATGEPIEVNLALEITGDHMRVDFVGSGDQTRSAANCTFPTTAAIIYTVTASLFPEAPLNYGLMRAIEIDAPVGSVVNATFPTAVSAMATTTFDIIVACLMGAFSKAAPERAIAASYNLQSFITSGRDPRTGSDFITYSWGPGGWGAGRDSDGRTAMALYTTTTTNIPCEAEERRIPFMIEEYRILPDTGGAGRRRGGNCLQRVFRFGYHGVLSTFSGRGRFPIWGLFGGGAGGHQWARLETAEGERELDLLAEGLVLSPGDRLTYTNGGGGGYGPPREREAELVLEDVLEEWITPRAARDIYRVALREVPDTSLTTTYEVDWDATSELRASGAADD